MLLANASSKADCVTDASSKSLKLLPILGVPSLPSRPKALPLPPGLRPASSAGLRGDNGVSGAILCLCLGWFPLSLESWLARGAEPAEESEVWLCCVTSVAFLVPVRLEICLGSPRRVALGS